MNLIQYYLGIDLHKRTSYVTLMDQEGKVKLKKNLKNEEIKEWIREMTLFAYVCKKKSKLCLINQKKIIFSQSRSGQHERKSILLQN